MDKKIKQMLRKFEATEDPGIGYQLASLLTRQPGHDNLFYRILIFLYEDKPGDQRGLAVATLLLQRDKLGKIEKSVLSDSKSPQHRASFLAILYVYAILFDFPLDKIRLNFPDINNPPEYYVNTDRHLLIDYDTYVTAYAGRNPLCCYRIEAGNIVDFIRDFQPTRKILSDYYGLEKEYPEIEEIWDADTQKTLKYPTPERVIIISSQPSYDYETGRPIQARGGGRVRWRKPEGLVTLQLIIDDEEYIPMEEDEDDDEKVVSFYLNSYIITEQYGGREEGGWYCNILDPQSTARVGEWKRSDIRDFNRRRGYEPLEDLKKDFPFISLFSLCFDLYEDQAERRAELNVWLEETPAVYSPQERPRYE